MNLAEHPEYDKYLSDREFVEAVRTKLLDWMQKDETAASELKTAVFHLTTLFQEYNRVMWQAFPFCKMCLGGCCVVGASEVTAIDVAALTVLGHDLPILPNQTHHNERACVYLGEKGCTWPNQWRPLKCMTFFSLGSGSWQLDEADADYGRLSQALQVVFDAHLPAIFGGNSNIDTEEVVEPIQFAAKLSHQLAELLLPEAIRNKRNNTPTDEPDPITNAFLFIASSMERITENPTEEDEMLLADLAQFEWILTGQPANMKVLLEEINGRYATSANPIHVQFNHHINAIKNLDNHN